MKVRDADSPMTTITVPGALTASASSGALSLRSAKRSSWYALYSCVWATYSETSFQLRAIDVSGSTKNGSQTPSTQESSASAAFLPAVSGFAAR